MSHTSFQVIPKLWIYPIKNRANARIFQNFGYLQDTPFFLAGGVQHSKSVAVVQPVPKPQGKTYPNAFFCWGYAY